MEKSLIKKFENIKENKREYISKTNKNVWKKEDHKSWGL